MLVSGDAVRPVGTGVSSLLVTSPKLVVRISFNVVSSGVAVLPAVSTDERNVVATIGMRVDVRGF